MIRTLSSSWAASRACSFYRLPNVQDLPVNKSQGLLCRFLGILFGVSAGGRSLIKPSFVAASIIDVCLSVTGLPNSVALDIVDHLRNAMGGAGTGGLLTFTALIVTMRLPPLPGLATILRRVRNRLTARFWDRLQRRACRGPRQRYFGKMRGEGRSW